MKLEQIKVAQNMQKLFIHVTSLTYLNLKIMCILTALFISKGMFSPYYPIKKISKVIVATKNSIINITLK